MSPSEDDVCPHCRTDLPARPPYRLADGWRTPGRRPWDLALMDHLQTTHPSRWRALREALAAGHCPDGT